MHVLLPAAGWMCAGSMRVPVWNACTPSGALVRPHTRTSSASYAAAAQQRQPPSLRPRSSLPVAWPPHGRHAAQQQQQQRWAIFCAAHPPSAPASRGCSAPPRQQRQRQQPHRRVPLLPRVQEEVELAGVARRSRAARARKRKVGAARQRGIRGCSLHDQWHRVMCGCTGLVGACRTASRTASHACLHARTHARTQEREQPTKPGSA